MALKFETDYKTILEKIDQIDPIAYGKTRNYVDGAVTCLSPYISRGVICTKQVLETVLAKGYKIAQIESFVKELCWRDYFQRVAQVKDVNVDIKQSQNPILNYEIPAQIVNATTGIEGIDNAIKQLYQAGYMHNHCRMYTASLVCNIAQSHWHHPAQWMYYHLLDCDWASNACSWQWVAGANSHKKYYANQENINKYTKTNQVDTYLDKPYGVLETMEAPAQLLATEKFNATIELPVSGKIELDLALPTFIYNYYNIDPLWHKDEPGNRVLLIEPSFFSNYPVSKNCIDFMLALSKNIPNIKVYVGSFQLLSDAYNAGNIYYKEHPLNVGYSGNKEERDWIAPAISGYYPSFFAYWKKVEKHLYK
ncbi:FAD-binding domain-containing protein [Parasediminibacterium sp. JCM 36343]|uniref:FAD-binding domain-containing protein n=1 Tax=Parasediminibacterium sp. JCM 36343 TaxID=3374279 RepID=UPI0039799372